MLRATNHTHEEGTDLPTFRDMLIIDEVESLNYDAPYWKVLDLVEDFPAPSKDKTNDLTLTIRGHCSGTTLVFFQK